jgi:hypothetical protein
MKQFTFKCKVIANAYGFVSAKSLKEAKEKCKAQKFDDIIDETDQEYLDFYDFETEE